MQIGSISLMCIWRYGSVNQMGSNEGTCREMTVNVFNCAPIGRKHKGPVLVEI